MHHIYKNCMQSRTYQQRQSLVKINQNTHLVICKFVLIILLLQFKTPEMFVYSRRLLMIWVIDNVVSLVVSVGFTCLAFVISSLLLNRIFQQDHLKLFPNIIIYLILHSIPLPRRPENHHPPVPPLCTGISKADNNITSNLNELLAK